VGTEVLFLGIFQYLRLRKIIPWCQRRHELTIGLLAVVFRLPVGGVAPAK
jgi:hypothetical protein